MYHGYIFQFSIFLFQYIVHYIYLYNKKKGEMDLEEIRGLGKSLLFLGFFGVISGSHIKSISYTTKTNCI